MELGGLVGFFNKFEYFKEKMDGLVDFLKGNFEVLY